MIKCIPLNTWIEQISTSYESDMAGGSYQMKSGNANVCQSSSCDRLWGVNVTLSPAGRHMVQCWASPPTQSQRIMGVQSVDVMLICGVTDCWRRGHLLTVYLCPVPSIYLLTSGSGCDDHMCSQAWIDGDPRRWPSSFYQVKQLSSPEHGAHWTLMLPRGELSEPYSTSVAPGTHCLPKSF